MDKVKKNLQRMHEIAQEASAGVRAALSTSAWEPKFEAIAHDQEQLAINFCNEIAQRRLGPVRLIEMAEALYLAERNDPVVGASAAPQASQPIGQPESGKWVPCTPDLIRAGVDCGKTPRRPGDGYSHDHFIAHSQPVSGAGMTDDEIITHAKKYCVFDDEKREYDPLRYELAEDFINMIRALLSASGQAGQSDDWMARIADAKAEWEADRAVCLKLLEKENAELVKVLESIVRQAEPILLQNGVGMGCFNRARRVLERYRALSSTPAQQTEAPVNVPELNVVREAMMSAYFGTGDWSKKLNAAISLVDVMLSAAPAPVQTEAQQSAKELNSDEIFQIADAHASVSRENGVRSFSRSGLIQFVRDAIAKEKSK